MSAEASGSDAEKRRHRRLTRSVKGSLRELNVQLSLLNHSIGARLKLKDVDLYCLDLISREGPLSPTAVARRAGLHPATTTGVLDRLERGGWVVRERDPDDRRAVVVRFLGDRSGELYRLLSGMNASMDEICADYSVAELEIIADFLERTKTAGRHATDDLTIGS